MTRGLGPVRSRILSFIQVVQYADPDINSHNKTRMSLPHNERYHKHSFLKGQAFFWQKWGWGCLFFLTKTMFVQDGENGRCLTFHYWRWQSPWNEAQNEMVKKDQQKRLKNSAKEERVKTIFKVICCLSKKFHISFKEERAIQFIFSRVL